MTARHLLTARSRAFAIALAGAVAVCGASLSAANPFREQLLGRKVEDFVLRDVISGKLWKLSEQIERAKVIVLYFNSTECPVTNRYLPSLDKLHANLADEKVVIVTINTITIPITMT